HMPQTRLPDHSRSPPGTQLARTIFASYRTLIGTRRFLAYALTATGAHAGFHIFAAGAPAVLIIGFGIPPEDYGYYASLPPIGFLIGSFLSSRLIQRLCVHNLLALAGSFWLPSGLPIVPLPL